MGNFFVRWSVVAYRFPFKAADKKCFCVFMCQWIIFSYIAKLLLNGIEYFSDTYYFVLNSMSGLLAKFATLRLK